MFLFLIFVYRFTLSFKNFFLKKKNYFNDVLNEPYPPSKRRKIIKSTEGL